MEIVIASKQNKIKKQLIEAISKFENFRDLSVEVTQYSSYLELINESTGSEDVIFTDESLINSEEELHFLKILKNKNAAVNLVHIYDKYVPFSMDEFVLNATSKFLKLDSNINKSALRSLTVLTQKELSSAPYGY